MRLDRNSWHVRLNRFVYGQEAKLNPNLCPYFWKTVVALPLSLLAALGTLVRTLVHNYQTRSGVASDSLAFQKTRYHSEDPVRVYSNLSIGFDYGGLLVLAVGILVLIGIVIHAIIMAPASLLVIAGIAVVGALIFGLYISFDLWGGMIYSFYEGVCPAVKWTDSSVVDEPEAECEDAEFCSPEICAVIDEILNQEVDETEATEEVEVPATDEE
jgi:hypothetical protein